jgi:O-antigen ligase
VNIPGQPETGASFSGDRRWPIVAAVAILAVVVGATLAQANWILIAALLVLPIFLLRPRELSLGIYAFLLPFDSLTAVGPEGVTLTSIAGAAVVAILLGTALVRKQLHKPPRQALWWTLFVGWAGVTVLWALEWKPATGRLPTAISLLVVYLVVLSTNISRKELQTVSLFLIGGGCAASLYTIYQFLGGSGYHGSNRGSLMTENAATDPNYFAASLLLPLSLAIYGFLIPRSWLVRVRWLAVTGIIAFGILVTMSRGSLVAVGVMFLFYMYTRHVSRRMLIPVVAIFVALAFVLPDSFFARLETGAQGESSGRTTIWQGGLVAFEHYALAGAGLNNFPYAYQKNLGSSPILQHQTVWAPHNSYLEIGVDTGLIGLVLMLTAIVTQLRSASRRRKNTNKLGSVIIAYEAGCYGILVAVFFIGAIWDKWFWLSWILLAVAVRTAPVEQHAEAPVPVAQTVTLRWHDWPVRSAPRTRFPQ